MTSLSDDDVITEKFFICTNATCQRIIFQMCGLPLLYLKKCGHNLTPRFLALGKPCIYISIYLSIYLSVTKAIAGLQIRALLKLLGCLYNN